MFFFLQGEVSWKLKTASALKKISYGKGSWFLLSSGVYILTSVNPMEENGKMAFWVRILLQ